MFRHEGDPDAPKYLGINLYRSILFLIDYELKTKIPIKKNLI